MASFLVGTPHGPVEICENTILPQGKGAFYDAKGLTTRWTSYPASKDDVRFYNDLHFSQYGIPLIYIEISAADYANLQLQVMGSPGARIMTAAGLVPTYINPHANIAAGTVLAFDPVSGTGTPYHAPPCIADFDALYNDYFSKTGRGVDYVQFLPSDYSTFTSSLGLPVGSGYLAAQVTLPTPIQFTSTLISIPIKCECGADAIKAPIHSNWCAKAATL
jgi:hypothetical protein